MTDNTNLPPTPHSNPPEVDAFTLAMSNLAAAGIGFQVVADEWVPGADGRSGPDVLHPVQVAA